MPGMLVPVGEAVQTILFFSMPLMVPFALLQLFPFLALFGTGGEVMFTSLSPDFIYPTMCLNLRFMVDRDVVGCNWIELPAGKYRLRPDPSGSSSKENPAKVMCRGGFDHQREGHEQGVCCYRCSSVVRHMNAVQVEGSVQDATG